ncbi:MAG: 2-isopropylmalate synthase, partial [Firmicutes bacterium]|nr:2-isopropylmalate synthase [Bacillota bacterium]
MIETVRIFDTTLRDGEQSPGVALTSQQKLSIAEQLARLGVDIVEAGFPQASAGDFAAVHLIARTIRGPVIAALARCMPGDIERAAQALEGADKARIHVFLATSPVHMRAKLHMSPEQVVDRAAEMVAYARRFTDDVEFSAEDATRSDPELLQKVIAAVVKSGATTINLPDTVGYATPNEYRRFVQQFVETFSPQNIVFSTHCHDDLGLAVANTLAGISGGCRQVEVAVNGIGERAGNAALEEVVMALQTHSDHYGAVSHVHTQEIYRTSQLVSQLTGMIVQSNKAIVGRNA